MEPIEMARTCQKYCVPGVRLLSATLVLAAVDVQVLHALSLVVSMQYW